MILESAVIKVKAGMEDEFEQAVAKALPLFQRAPGCISMQLLRGLEETLTYLLHVQWETVEDHTVHFRASDDFQEWRRLVGHCFDGPPHVSHFDVALPGF
ncbi:antibiotic biosynthesis monooxygenase family protein [Massilia niastensis]|uniref:antibiotic biosynthesis monooxygenase family protein n=1 Tax=Massilia niastensis TaxID=544911 RepID=UPI00037DDFBA|nr:antibiotic biosynthesis monooxygenase [Massilia niastensis]